MKVVEVKLQDITPYERNAKKHPPEQIEKLKKSIKLTKYKLTQPIVIDKNKIIVAGHGRYEAVKQLAAEDNTLFKTVPCYYVEDMTDDEVAAYRLIDNRVSESEIDFDIEQEEMNDIDFDFSVFDMDFDDNDFDIEEDTEQSYSQKTEIPQYEPTGDNISLDSCLDTDKYNELIEQIDKSDLDTSEKIFLKMAAARHLTFNYKNIANYYANASKEMQELMEKSALVIIDYDSAIANGYVKLTNKLKELRLGNA